MWQCERYLHGGAAHNFLGQEKVHPIGADISGFRRSLSDGLASGPANGHGEPELETWSGATLFGWQRDTHVEDHPI
jgi:hypothetical protein